VSPGAEPIYNENSRNVPGLEARREPRLNYRALRDRKETGAIVVTIAAYGAVRERVAGVLPRGSRRPCQRFNGDNCAAIGASCQTGWTGIIASMIEIFGKLGAQTFLRRGHEAAFGGRNNGHGPRPEAKNAKPAQNPLKGNTSLTGPTAAVMHPLESASFTPASRRSAAQLTVSWVPACAGATPSSAPVAVRAGRLISIPKDGRATRPEAGLDSE
jgi:hypothetical protein